MSEENNGMYTDESRFYWNFIVVKSYLIAVGCTALFPRSEVNMTNFCVLWNYCMRFPLRDKVMNNVIA